MCQFCTQHADGKRWYLEAKNYSEDLLSDLRRQSLFQEIAGSAFSDDKAEELKAEFEKIDKLDSLPRPVKALSSWMITRKMKRDHFGQVVPIEEVAEVFNIVDSIVRLPCTCRYALRREDHYYCFGISVNATRNLMREIFRGVHSKGPDVREFERVTSDDALALMRDWEQDGLVHTVWTFGTPFIGGVCNCDRSDCMGIIATIGRDLKVMFRSEFLANINWEMCNGCRSCMRVCQFGAIGYSAGHKKTFVDNRKCYGCGLCRSACSRDAISLVERSSVPEAADLW